MILWVWKHLLVETFFNLVWVQWSAKTICCLQNARRKLWSKNESNLDFILDHYKLNFSSVNWCSIFHYKSWICDNLWCLHHDHHSLAIEMKIEFHQMQSFCQKMKWKMDFHWRIIVIWLSFSVIDPLILVKRLPTKSGQFHGIKMLQHFIVTQVSLELQVDRKFG